jgi:hypothetical protein
MNVQSEATVKYIETSKKTWEAMTYEEKVALSNHWYAHVKDAEALHNDYLKALKALKDFVEETESPENNKIIVKLANLIEKRKAGIIPGKGRWTKKTSEEGEESTEEALEESSEDEDASIMEG